MAPNNSPWTDALLAKLKGCIDRNLSGGQAAMEMHMTANQLVGKAHRMGWHFNSPMARPKKGMGKPKAEKHIKVVQIAAYRAPEPPIAKAADFLGLALWQLNDDQCRYIEGDDHLFCGQPVLDDKSYCAFHNRLCYYPVTESKRKSL